jgi:DNA-binding PucR family transcriptional regulator
MTERISEELPELVADPDDLEANRSSNEANLVLVADLLERGADPYSVPLPAPTLAWAEDSAHHDTPLPGLLRVYRIGHTYGWQWILAYLREQVVDPADFAEAVDLISIWLHSFVDAGVGLAEEAYTRERERWLRSSSALQAETIREILDGGPTDQKAASLRLGYDLDRSHLGLVAWLAGADEQPDPVAATEAVLREVAVRVGSGRALIHPTGLATAVAWISSPGELDDAAAGAIDLGPGEPAGVRIAVGEPGWGIDGFRRSHLEAMQARRVAVLGDLPPGSVTYHSAVALAALATADLEQAGAFVRRRLGPLVARDETSLRLVATLRAYLDEATSHSRAATSLGIHENTVRYRVRQAEDLLGRPVGSHDLDLRVALALADAVPAIGGSAE